MEKENLRKELMAKMDSEREPILKEKEALENKLRLIEEAGPTLTREQVTALEQNLTQSQARLVDSSTKLLKIPQEGVLQSANCKCILWPIIARYDLLLS